MVMTEKLEYVFSIKRVKKTSDIDYINAIKIYNENIPFDIRTASNELTLWLNEDSNKSPFVLYCFVLYINGQVVGFAMETYIKRTKIMVGEYITLDNEYNFETVLFSFLDLMHNYYRVNSIDISYFVNEISNKDNGNSIDKESKLFKKILCVQGFGEIIAPYSTLPLGLSNFESSFDAKIFIKSNDNIVSISKETYLSIAESIYYDYYIVWYKKIFTEKENNKYKQIVDNMYNSLINSLNKDDILKVEYVDCPILKDNRESFKTITINQKKKNRVWTWILIVFVVLLLPPLITILYTWICKQLNIGISDTGSLMGESIGGLLTFASAYIIYKKLL